MTYDRTNPAPGTRLWRLRTHPDTLERDDAVALARALDDDLSALEAARDDTVAMLSELMVVRCDRCGRVLKHSWQVGGFTLGRVCVRLWEHPLDDTTPAYHVEEVSVVDGEAILPDGRRVRSDAKVVRVPVLNEASRD